MFYAKWFVDGEWHMSDYQGSFEQVKEHAEEQDAPYAICFADAIVYLGTPSIKRPRRLQFFLDTEGAYVIDIPLGRTGGFKVDVQPDLPALSPTDLNRFEEDVKRWVSLSHHEPYEMNAFHFNWGDNTCGRIVYWYYYEKEEQCTS